MDIHFQLHGVRKYYRQPDGLFRKKKVPVLDGLELELHHHCINAVVGPSGAGKSTLARILMRLEDWDEGDIFCGGKPIRTLSKKDYWREHRIMFQNPYSAVNPGFDVFNIIGEPLKIAGAGPDAVMRRVEELSHLLGIHESLMRRYPDQVSGGELQRVALARTLSTEPSFVILDEPFSSLDEIMADRLAREFKAIFRQLAIGVLFISHHNRRVRFMADRVTELSRGKRMGIYNGF